MIQIHISSFLFPLVFFLEIQYNEKQISGKQTTLEESGKAKDRWRTTTLLQRETCVSGRVSRTIRF